MTTIPAISPPATSIETAQAASTTRSVLSSDFETFLQMLTTQAKYQDPLEPVSSSEYAAQLAQFSMVEQQVFTNEQLGLLASALNADTMNTMASWVGMEARAVTSAQFNGQPVNVVPKIAAGAESAQLVVFDEGGTERARRDISVTATTVAWDGLDQAGAVLPPSSYSFAVDSFSSGELIASNPAETYARVIEAQRVGGDIVLKTDTGQSIPASAVTALRAAQT